MRIVLVIFGTNGMKFQNIVLFLFEKRNTMPTTNPLITSEEEQFVVGESDFAFFDNYAFRVENAAMLLCREGSAEAMVDQSRGPLRRDAIVLLLPGALFMLSDRTENFRVSYCAFSQSLLDEAAFRLDPSFFHTLRCNPLSYPSPQFVEGASVWFKLAEYTYADRENSFRNTIIKNRLQNVLLECYDKVQRFSADFIRQTDTTSRQVQLFHRFVKLVNDHSVREREVGFYADKLCISTRYLSTIVRNVVHSSAKEFIDHAVVLEIKMLLQSTDLSVQEIAYRLKFPDQSYLGRYFRKHTGESPTAFRNGRK